MSTSRVSGLTCATATMVTRVVSRARAFKGLLEGAGFVYGPAPEVDPDAPESSLLHCRFGSRCRFCHARLWRCAEARGPRRDHARGRLVHGRMVLAAVRRDAYRA